MDLKPIDSTLFSENSKPLIKQKEKFTFFCPQRMGIPKGTDILWEALKFCKSDFEILQVDWRDNGTEEENRTSLRLRENLPSQVKLIPRMKMKYLYLSKYLMIGLLILIGRTKLFFYLD